jgi:hypothetical protein
LELNISISAVTENSAITFCDILNTISPLQTLESLKLSVDGQGFNFMDDSLPETYTIPPHWHTLHFEMARGENFLESLFETAEADEVAIPVFSSLSMQDGWPQGRCFLGRYLCDYGSEMDYLRFDCSSDNSELSSVSTRDYTHNSKHNPVYKAPEALLFCTALTRLDLRFATSKVPGTLLMIFPYLKSPSLATINVIDPKELVAGSLSRHVDKWQALDQAISEGRFELAGLRTLSFTLSSPGSAEKLHQNMRLCAARGILSVVNMSPTD